MRKIQDNLAKLHHTHVLITESRNSTASMVRKLNRFAQDTAWAGPLNDCIYSQEIQSFFSFPLEYNGRNGTPLDYFPYQETLDSKTALFIATCLRNPYSSAECILLDIVRAKATNARLRALRRVPCEPSANFCKLSAKRRRGEQRLTFGFYRFCGRIGAERSADTVRVGEVRLGDALQGGGEDVGDFARDQRGVEDVGGDARQGICVQQEAVRGIRL